MVQQNFGDLILLLVDGGVKGREAPLIFCFDVGSFIKKSFDVLNLAIFHCDVQKPQALVFVGKDTNDSDCGHATYIMAMAMAAIIP